MTKENVTYNSKKIITIAYPILISLLMEQMIGLTDTAFMGRVGEVELGATAIAGVYYMVIFMVGLGFSVGAQILIGRRNGEGNYRAIGRVFYQGAFFLLGLAAVLFTLSQIFSNEILSAMISEKKDYDTVLKEAQKAGLAEADPTLDVTGVDSAHKLAILSSLAFSTDTDFEAIPVEGVDQLELFDINTADEMGYTIKLLAIAQQCSDGISLCVRPSFIKKDHQLALVSGSFNAVSVYANNLGPSMYSGQGAGSLPTASAVVSDLISLALGYRETRFDALPLWPDKNKRLPQLPLDRYAGRYYLRLDVEDKTGVLAQVTEVLGRNQIGISEAVQKDPQPQRAVSLVLTTHRTTEGAVKRAVAELKQIPEIIKVITIAIVDEAK